MADDVALECARSANLLDDVGGSRPGRWLSALPTARKCGPLSRWRGSPSFARDVRGVWQSQGRWLRSRSSCRPSTDWFRRGGAGSSSTRARRTGTIVPPPSTVERARKRLDAVLRERQEVLRAIMVGDSDGGSPSAPLAGIRTPRSRRACDNARTMRYALRITRQCSRPRQAGDGSPLAQR